MNPAPAPAISSLILTLSADAAAESAALNALGQFPGLELGNYQRPWLPAVLETATPKDICEELRGLAGVEFVEVAFVEVPDPTPLPAVS